LWTSGIGDPRSKVLIFMGKSAGADQDRPGAPVVLHAPYMMDTVGNKAAKQAIAEIKVAVPSMTLQVVD
jgi:hypothetical protein